MVVPNHVKNIIHMKGITTLPVYVVDKYKDRGGIDFNKVLPMPESLNLDSGSIEYLAIDAINRKLNERMYRLQPKNCYMLLSDEEFQKSLAAHKKTEKEILELGLQYITNLVRYNATTLYDWCCDNWGTKWNAYSDEKIDDDSISFETAWAPPIPVMKKLSADYPELVIEHWWADENVGSNDGHIIYSKGERKEGGFVEDNSKSAYDIYVMCWGLSDCLFRDKEGIVHHRDCDKCKKCERR